MKKFKLRIRLASLGCITCILLACHTQDVSKVSFEIVRLEKAENAGSLADIENIFDDQAILYTTDLMPVTGKEAILSIYKFIFDRNDVQNIKYLVDSSNSMGHRIYESGQVVTQRINEQPTTQPFKALFSKQNSDFKIMEIAFGEESNLKTELPQMLKPTGGYNIGLQNFFYPRSESGNGRLLSFQIWYPTQSDLGTPLPFRSEQVITHASAFLGLPDFAISFLTEIPSHSRLRPPPVRLAKFPVLLYNHGYGGYTQVYQSVFEDLVSHGYIVVSIAHEDESALMIKANGEVIPNTPQNSFFAQRAPELNGEKIGRWQAVILNSDHIQENRQGYEHMLEMTPLHNESTRLWASDTRMTLKKIKLINNKQGEILNDIFDLDRIGIFGHSLGGATAGQMCYGENEIKAGINLDGFQFGDLFNHRLEVPFMFVSSNPEEDRYLRPIVFMKEAKQACYHAVIKGFAHDYFTDLHYMIEGDHQAIELQRALVRSFFDKHLKQVPVDLDALQDRYPSISFR